MSVHLRAARSTDAGKLGQMITDAVAAKPWKPRLHTGAEDIAHAGTMIDRGWVTVAEKGEVLGFVARDAAFIHALFIRQDTRGQGIGKALIDGAKEQSDLLELWTFVETRGARRFYKREGFTEIERGDGSTNEEGLPDVHFRWERTTS